MNLHVKVGDIVKGQPLYGLDVSRNTIGGNVSAAQIKLSMKRFANAEDIISKLTRRLETLAALENRLKPPAPR